MRKPKKEYPQGTFIATPARVMAILQLCLALTCLIWVMGYPFMGEHFEIKKKKLLYERIVKDPGFQELSLSERNGIQSGYQELGNTETSLLGKLKESLEILLLRISRFELIWILLGLVIPIALLKKVEGARQVVWLFPVVTLAFAWENVSKPNDPKSERALYPSEKIIIEKYLGGNFSTNILDQREQLLLGWQNYLIREWAKEEPSPNGDVFSQQHNKGDFLFSVERLKRIENGQTNPFREQVSPLLLLLYFIWNFLFALVVAITLRRKVAIN